MYEHITTICESSKNKNYYKNIISLNVIPGRSQTQNQEDEKMDTPLQGKKEVDFHPLKFNSRGIRSIKNQGFDLQERGLFLPSRVNADKGVNKSNCQHVSPFHPMTKQSTAMYKEKTWNTLTCDWPS